MQNNTADTTPPQPDSTPLRNVGQVLEGQATEDGDGVRLTRIIGGSQLPLLDPFLLLDAFESERPDDYIGGFPTHPHRGFETVTYLLAGRMRHADSTGTNGVIEAGGVQWMRAGSGILHSEMPEQENGLLFGFQLWVNLPATLKMSAPNYQELPARKIPVERQPGCRVRVITGRTRRGTCGPVEVAPTEPLFLDITLERGYRFSQPLSDTHNAFIYVIEGALVIDATCPADKHTITAKRLATLPGPGDLSLQATQDARALIIAARRLDEPVARGGPFVMNTRDEVMQAFNDYSNGTLAAPRQEKN